VAPVAYLDTLDFLPPGAVSTLPFLLVATVALGGLPLGAALWMLLKSRALAMQGATLAGRLVKRSGWPLSPGPGRVIRGRVEPLGDEDTAARVTVVQEARNRTTKQARWHEWGEISRDSTVSPFALVRDDGQRVRVESGKDVLLIGALVTDALDANAPRRVRCAEARRGQVFCAYGDLHKQETPGGGAYRSNLEPWVLRPSRGTGRMLLTSAPLDDRYVGCAQVLRRGALVVGAVLVLFHVAFTVPVLVALRRAEPSVASYEQTSCARPVRGQRQCVVTVALKAGVVRGVQVPYRAASALQSLQLTAPQRLQVPVLVDRSSGAVTAIGHDAGVRPWPLLLGFGLLAFAFGGTWVAYRRALKWYDRGKLVEPGDAGHWPPGAAAHVA
jgi:hypothetical protein